MHLTPNPWQPVGPFFHFCLTPAGYSDKMAGPEARGERISLVCRIFDGAGTLTTNGMIELWQADATGRLHHPADPQSHSADPAFQGFGRADNYPDGECIFETIKPGRTPAPNGQLQAPHINASIFAAGILSRLVTRVYFEGDPANDTDFVLSFVPPARRRTLMARPDPQRPGTWNFNIHLQGPNETVFFDI
jgi:protocatechuate 3,4-dioxygenase alpha subunit